MRFHVRREVRVQLAGVDTHLAHRGPIDIALFLHNLTRAGTRHGRSRHAWRCLSRPRRRRCPFLACHGGAGGAEKDTSEARTSSLMWGVRLQHAPARVVDADASATRSSRSRSSSLRISCTRRTTSRAKPRPRARRRRPCRARPRRPHYLGPEAAAVDHVHHEVLHGHRVAQAAGRCLRLDCASRAAVRLLMALATLARRP